MKKIAEAEAAEKARGKVSERTGAVPDENQKRTIDPRSPGTIGERPSVAEEQQLGEEMEVRPIKGRLFIPRVRCPKCEVDRPKIIIRRDKQYCSHCGEQIGKALPEKPQKIKKG